MTWQLYVPKKRQGEDLAALKVKKRKLIGEEAKAKKDIKAHGGFSEDFFRGASRAKSHSRQETYRSETKINSGDIITLTTDNPETHPLPSKALLRLQWHLNRTAALAGGAEALDITWDMDDSDPNYDQYDEYICGFQY